MKNFVVWGAIALGLCGSLQGCVSAEAKAEISTNSAGSDRVLQLWDGLTPVQQKLAYWKQARAWHNLDYSINSAPIPAEFADPAPVTSGQ